MKHFCSLYRSVSVREARLLQMSPSRSEAPLSEPEQPRPSSDIARNVEQRVNLLSALISSNRGILDQARERYANSFQQLTQREGAALDRENPRLSRTNPAQFNQLWQQRVEAAVPAFRAREIDSINRTILNNSPVRLTAYVNGTLAESGANYSIVEAGQENRVLPENVQAIMRRQMLTYSQAQQRFLQQNNLSRLPVLEIERVLRNNATLRSAALQQVQLPYLRIFNEELSRAGAPGRHFISADASGLNLQFAPAADVTASNALPVRQVSQPVAVEQPLRAPVTPRAPVVPPLANPLANPRSSESVSSQTSAPSASVSENSEQNPLERFSQAFQRIAQMLSSFFGNVNRTAPNAVNTPATNTVPPQPAPVPPFQAPIR